MEGESRVSRSFIDEVHFSEILGDKMEGENGVSGSIMMNFILQI